MSYSDGGGFAALLQDLDELRQRREAEDMLKAEVAARHEWQDAAIQRQRLRARLEQQRQQEAARRRQRAVAMAKSMSAIQKDTARLEREVRQHSPQAKVARTIRQLDRRTDLSALEAAKLDVLRGRAAALGVRW